MRLKFGVWSTWWTSVNIFFVRKEIDRITIRPSIHGSIPGKDRLKWIGRIDLKCNFFNKNSFFKNCLKENACRHFFKMFIKFHFIIFQNLKNNYKSNILSSFSSSSSSSSSFSYKNVMSSGAWADNLLLLFHNWKFTWKNSLSQAPACLWEAPAVISITAGAIVR